MHAAAGGAAEVVQLLLQHKEAWGVDVDAVDAEGLSAVFYAVKGGSSKVLQLLHEAGIPLIGLSRSRASSYVPYGKQKHPQQQHPAQQQLQKEVGFAVQPQSCGRDRNGSSNPACNGKNPEGEGLLWLACEEGSLDVLKWLLQQGIGVSALLAHDGSNPVFAAARGGAAAVVSYLVQAGALLEPKDERGWTPLAWAAASGQIAMVQHLVSLGANLLAQDHEGHVPRQLAYLNNHRAAAELLSAAARHKVLAAQQADKDSSCSGAGSFM